MRNLVVSMIGTGILACVPLAVRGEGDDSKTSKSVVKIFSSLHSPDVYRPWAKESPSEARGSGVVISGKRILTNAHVVERASQIFVQFDKSSEKLAATLVAAAPGIDLAVLKLENEAVFDDHPALPMSSRIPGVQQAVFAFGYPEGGTDLSITRGIISRIEFADFYIGVQGVRIQIDAAINPGNSGGPVVADGKLIGIAFSKLEKSDNIGYIIPLEEINLFLKDIEDGHYDGKPILDVETQDLENQTLRERHHLDKQTGGVLVRKIHRPDTPYPLAVDDILTKIGSYSIDKMGMVRLEDDRSFKFQYLVQRLAHDGRLPVTVMHKGVETKIDVPVDSDPRRLFRDLSEEPLSYFIFGPLVFAEASEEYVRSMTSYVDKGGSGGSITMIYTGIPTFTRYGDDQRFAGERIVIVPSPMFSHKIGRGYSDPYTQAVAEVNGIHIRNLKHLIEVLRDASDPFVEFTFYGRFTDKIVFKRKEAMAATEEILNENGIRHQCSADMSKVWDLSKVK